jgi:hypothetical protein
MNKLFLLAARRSGSSYLLSFLNSHPQVKCYKNAFHRKRLLKNVAYLEKKSTLFYKFRSASIRRRIDFLLNRKNLITNFLTELYSSAKSFETVVIKISYPNEYPETLEWAIKNDIGIIHLIRRNLLKSIVYHSTSRAEPIIRLSPRLLKKRLDERIKQIEKYRSMFKNSHYYEVFDESIVADRKVVSSHLLDFISVNSFLPLTFGERRKNPGLEDILENYKEIVQALRGSVYEKFLRSDFDIN